MKYLLIICALCWNWTGTAIAAPEKSEVMKLLLMKWDTSSDCFIQQNQAEQCLIS